MFYSPAFIPNLIPPIMFRDQIITELQFQRTTLGREQSPMAGISFSFSFKTICGPTLLRRDIHSCTSIIQSNDLTGAIFGFLMEGFFLTLIPNNFGPYFVPRPNFVPLRNRWYCYELMVKANTAGRRDGRAAFWIDGKLIADFQNLRMRDINTLKIDRVQLTLQAKTCARLTRKWYDNLVVAKSYIGPLE